MAYQMGQSVCPQCGGSAQVRTVRELFDMLNGMQDQRSGNAGQFGQPGWGPGTPGGPGDDDYDHYNVEGSDYRRGSGGQRSTRGNDFDMGDMGDNVVDDIGGAVAAVAFGLVGRAIGRRIKQKFEERVVPAMQQRAAQAQQQWQDARADQETIVTRYPGLRGCLQDNVLFLDGGQRTVPIADLSFPVTLAQADAVVTRLQ